MDGGSTDCGHCFDFNQVARPRQRLYADKRARRRVVFRYISAPHPLQNVSIFMFIINNINIHLHDICKACAGCAQREFQVLVHLLRLRFEISVAYQVPVGILRYLT